MNDDDMVKDPVFLHVMVVNMMVKIVVRMVKILVKMVDML